ncbi:hypothetical protein ACWGA9_34210 [Streptomyces sp. NPDC054950]
MQCSNTDGRGLRVVRYLRKWCRRHGRIVHDQVVSGVAYGLGSGAVSVVVIWFQARQ